MVKTIRIIVRRQNNKEGTVRWDTFEIPYRENMNVVSALMDLRKSPRTIEGKAVEPPVFEAACLEEVCGSCTMNINGRVRQACSSLIENVGHLNGDTYVVTLEPMRKFPLVRDLLVDRSAMFANLIKVKAWVPIDGSFDRGMAPPQDDHVRRFRYELSRCMTCGCCLEACPQVNEKSAFFGPQTLAQALLFNKHPVGAALKGERLDAITEEDGLSNCGNAQNCVKVCPKEVPLTHAIAELNRDTTVYKAKKFLGLEV